MKSNQIGYSRQNIDKKDIKLVTKVLKSDFLTQGPMNKFFEKKLSNYLGSKNLLVVNNGTAALQLAIEILNIKKNEKVVIPTNTFIASANMVDRSGAKIIFCDIEKETFNIDLKKLETILKKNKIKLIIFTDFAGHPNDWDKIITLKKKYNFLIINDCCHSLGSEYKSSKKYAIKYADIVTYSFHAVKNITTGEGGAILIKKKSLYLKAKLLRSHGLKYNNDELNSYELTKPGFNFRLSDIQCALGVSQLERLDSFIKKKRNLARIYQKNFKNDFRFKLPIEKKEVKHSYHLFPVVINFNKMKINKRKLFSKLNKNGFKIQTHYKPLSKHRYFINKYKLKNQDFLNSNFYYKNAISFPMSSFYKTKQIKKFIDCLLKILKS